MSVCPSVGQSVRWSFDPLVDLVHAVELGYYGINDFFLDLFFAIMGYHGYYGFFHSPKTFERY